MSSRNHVERFGKLEDGLREDEVEDKIINWLENTTSYSGFEKYGTDVSHPKIIYGKSGIDTGNYGDNFIGMVDVALTIENGDLNMESVLNAKDSQQENRTLT